MPDFPNENALTVFRVLYDLVLAIKSSSTYRIRPSGDAFIKHRAFVMRLEGIKYSLFSIQNKFSEAPQVPLEESDILYLRNVSQEISQILNEFAEIAGNIQFREALGSKRRESLVGYEFRHLVDAIITAQDLLDTKLLPELQAETLTSDIGNVSAIKLIRDVLPEQKIAPAQFDVLNGRLVVVHQKASNGPDSDIASSARKALVETGQAVIDKLRETNCDRRMLDVVVNLQEKLQSQQDIVELGVFNISCEVVAAKFENELPDVVGAMLLAHSRGISGYVAQFAEWRTFTENAALAELSSADVRRLHESSGQLVEKLEKAPEVADPEVPKTIKLLRTLIADPTSIPKRAGYALLITLENLWSRVYGYAAEFLDSTIKKTIAISATAVAVTLVSIAAANALDLVPVTSKLADSAWVQTATKIIRRQLEELAKGAEKTE
ncbi:hypothetical protein [Asticcacaulis taihuensis]|uniref:hypothetical protein n=1 Tax=Asticcacaulis taihuensis TaxID=260084 RepID=UPI0026ED777F|nr:hypothetical protein [Asticcacaulis taihuensis]